MQSGIVTLLSIFFLLLTIVMQIQISLHEIKGEYVDASLQNRSIAFLFCELWKLCCNVTKNIR